MDYLYFVNSRGRVKRKPRFPQNWRARATRLRGGTQAAPALRASQISDLKLKSCIQKDRDAGTSGSGRDRRTGSSSISDLRFEILDSKFRS